MALENDVVQHQIERESIDAKAGEILLKDQSSGKSLIWATQDYSGFGSNFCFDNPILPHALFGNGSSLIMPRILKDKAILGSRTRHKAEVFTPSWVCNRQNNLIDNAWFGSEEVFNRETNESWEVNPEKVEFSTKTGKSWRDYVDARRMEISCGEAPYLASRYDTVSGIKIQVTKRIGILDRKLRIVSENTSTPEEWFAWAVRAVEACYGYEWQGDSLFLARENLLLSVDDHHQSVFSIGLTKRQQRIIAYRLSWNLWQMDALKGVIPGSCHDDIIEALPTLDQMADKNCPEKGSLIKRQCPGCSKNEIVLHNGTYCNVKDWRSKVVHRYIDIMHTKKGRGESVRSHENSL